MQVHFNVPSSWLEKSIYIKTGYFIDIKQAQVVWIDNLPVLKIKQLNVYKDQTKKIQQKKSSFRFKLEKKNAYLKKSKKIKIDFQLSLLIYCGTDG